MSTSLSAGLSGLLAHQRKLDVVGHNLANVNTTGYKARRTRFADMIYQEVKPVAGASTTSSGTGAIQVGSGVRISHVSIAFGQGTLEETGGEFDFAIDGGGFFVLNGADNTNLYTRAGSFQLDTDGMLVDAGTGLAVQRLGTLGDIDGPGIGFQEPGDDRIVIPFGTQLPGVVTTNLELEGNLDASAAKPLSRTLVSAAPMLDGGAPATAATLLNDLDTSINPFVTGDRINIVGSDADGTPLSTSMAVDGTTTVGDLVTAVSAAFPGATASIDGDGTFTLTADATGESLLSLDLEGATGNTGSMNLAAHRMLIGETGNDGAVVDSSVEVFDQQGRAHIIQLQYQKVDNNEWSIRASIDEDSGSIIDGEIQRIRFGEDGSFQQVESVGIGDASFTFQFDGQANPQTIEVELGTPNQFNGLTQTSNPSATRTTQDGFPAGELLEASITEDGIIEGIASNGRRVVIAQIAMATFQNQSGLDARGSNQYAESAVSGEANIGSGTTGGRGSVRIGQLEASTVDVALEFTQLIVAQRGFSASARTITVTDEVLQELNGIIR
ncbi:MAG: flagellar hook protein FlgE [Planctomycetaceae bacterium]